MRSILATLLLGFAAALVCALVAWQWQKGNFDSVFGAPPIPVGEQVYTSFTPDKVRHIRVTHGGTAATFSLTDKGWLATSPWTDRMDPRAAVSIVNFTLGLRVEDYARDDEIDPATTGLGETAVGIRLEDENHIPLANYKLGRVTPWKAEVKEVEQPVPTVYVQTRDKHRKHNVYACTDSTGDINLLFKDGLKYLRDHHPFYFNPLTLQKIRIRTQLGDLTLGQAGPGQWRIVKPLDLATDPKVMKTLLERLFELQATQLTDRHAVTLPSKDSTAKAGQIALLPAGTETETVLEILPPESPEAKESKATVSDRPDTVFDLPIKPAPGLLSLADLPLTVNELRDPTLTHIDIKQLRGVSVQPSTGAEILLTCEPPKPWMATVSGATFEANEENVYKLLKAVTTGRAIGFESDAATDFTPWGLNHPVLTLRFLFKNNEAIELRFGIDGKGGWFVNRLGTPTVMRVDGLLVSSIAVRPYEWRQSRLWSLDRFNLLGIKRAWEKEAPITLKYGEFYEDKWQAEQDGRDLTSTLDPTRVNYLLGSLEELKVSQWLATDDENCAKALKLPTLTLTVTEFTVDDEGERKGVIDRVLTFAPCPANEHPGFCYGRLDKEAHPFLIDVETYQKLAVRLFDK